MANYNAYSKEIIDWVRDNCKMVMNEDLAKMCNEKFGTHFTRQSMCQFKSNHKIRSEWGDKKNWRTGKFVTIPNDVKDWIRDNHKGKTVQQMIDGIRSDLGIEMKKGQVKTVMDSKGYRSEVDTRFNKGHIHKEYGNKFSAGHKPACTLPTNAESFKGGFWWKKLEDGVWVRKSRYLWELANGPIPDGCVVTYKDGDSNNCSIDNLILISRTELIHMNHTGLRSDDPDLNESCIYLAKLQVELNKRRKSEIHSNGKTKNDCDRSRCPEV